MKGELRSVISVYAPGMERSKEERDSFWEELNVYIEHVKIEEEYW